MTSSGPIGPSVDWTSVVDLGPSGVQVRESLIVLNVGAAAGLGKVAGSVS